jgi:Tfp pilus assembly protein PilV
MFHRVSPSEAGFSLLEVCMAAGLVAAALVTLAALFAAAIESNLAARHQTYAVVLAQHKIEELRAIAPALEAPAAGVEYLDLAGLVVRGGAPPPGTAFERRWSVAPLAAGAAGLLVIDVSVIPRANRALERHDARVATIVRGRP